MKSLSYETQFNDAGKCVYFVIVTYMYKYNKSLKWEGFFHPGVYHLVSRTPTTMHYNVRKSGVTSDGC